MLGMQADGDAEVADALLAHAGAMRQLHRMNVPERRVVSEHLSVQHADEVLAHLPRRHLHQHA